VIDLTGTRHVEISCIELTDHAGCVADHSGGLACSRDEPFGAWASVGLYATDATDIVLRDLDIHGFADAGVRAGRLADWSTDGLRIAGNGWVGWDGDVDGEDANSGTLHFRGWIVEWNGCAETYPDGEPVGCWGQSAGGYGDGVGTGETGGDWVIEDSVFRYNTSDGLDLLYTRLPGASVTIRRTAAVGNAGDQVKTAGRTSIENLVAVSNCGYFRGQSFTHDVDPCRAGGSAIALNTLPGNEISIVNATIAGHGDCLVIAECVEGEDCDGTELVLIHNSILLGAEEFEGEGDITCLAWSGFAHDPFDFDTVIIGNVKLGNGCPAPNGCANPSPVTDADVDTFDPHLPAGSAAINAGSSDSAPIDDIDGRTRDGQPDIGAYEAG
jgi:hypothetical protein